MNSKDELKLLAHMKSPVTKNAAFYIEINRYFTDVDGRVLDKNTVPIALQTDYPFWMFGEFDRQGGYKQGNQVSAPDLAVDYLGSFTKGIEQPFLYATGFNTIKNRMNLGDIAFVFTDDIENPTYYIWVLLQNSFVSLASVFANSISGEKMKVRIKGVNYFASNINSQWGQGINVTRFDSLGNTVNDIVDPLAYRQTLNQQNNEIRIPLNFIIDQYLMLSSYITFANDNIRLSFLVDQPFVIN